MLLMMAPTEDRAAARDLDNRARADRDRRRGRRVQRRSAGRVVPEGALVTEARAVKRERLAVGRRRGQFEGRARADDGARVGSGRPQRSGGARGKDPRVDRRHAGIRIIGGERQDARVAGAQPLGDRPGCGGARDGRPESALRCPGPVETVSGKSPGGRSTGCSRSGSGRHRCPPWLSRGSGTPTGD